MKKSRLLGVVCAVFLLPELVAAASITFDNPVDTIPSGFWTGSFTTQNFVVTETVGSSQNHQFITIGGGPSSSTCSPACPYNGTNYLLNKDVGGSIIFSESSFAPFTLYSFEGAESHLGFSSSQWATSIQVTGTLATGGTVTTSFSLDFINDGEGSQVDFELFTLPSSFINLASVEFLGVGGTVRSDFSIDNIDFDLATSAVPTPPAAWLFGSAIGMLGLAGWKNRKSA